MTTAMRLTRRGRIVRAVFLVLVCWTLAALLGLAVQSSLPSCATMLDDGTVVGCE